MASPDAEARHDLRCGDCDYPHVVDTSLPSATWNQIATPGEMLCTDCIDKRLDAKGITAEAEFYFAGRALTGRPYEGSYGDVQALEVQVAALRTLLAERSREVHDEALHPNGRWAECGARPCRDDRAALAATKEDAHGD